MENDESNVTHLQGVGTIQLGEDGEYYLVTDMLEQLGWKEDDVLEWYHNEDGTFTLRKVVEE